MHYESEGAGGEHGMSEVSVKKRKGEIEKTIDVRSVDRAIAGSVR